MPTHEIIDQAIRKVPDFPKPGVLFYDITGILVNPKAFSSALTGWKSSMTRRRWTASLP